MFEICILSKPFSSIRCAACSVSSTNNSARDASLTSKTRTKTFKMRLAWSPSVFFVHSHPENLDPVYFDHTNTHSLLWYSCFSMCGARSSAWARALVCPCYLCRERLKLYFSASSVSLHITEVHWAVSACFVLSLNIVAPFLSKRCK